MYLTGGTSLGATLEEKMEGIGEGRREGEGEGEGGRGREREGEGRGYILMYSARCWNNLNIAYSSECFTTSTFSTCRSFMNSGRH